eukprot:4173911-Amphidinium_carterae.1
MSSFGTVSFLCPLMLALHTLSSAMRCSLSTDRVMEDANDKNRPGLQNHYTEKRHTITTKLLQNSTAIVL